MTDPTHSGKEQLCRMEGCGIPIAFNNLCPYHAHAPAHIYAYITQALSKGDYRQRMIEARQLYCYDPPITDNEKNAVYAAVLFLAKRNKLPQGAVTTDRDAVIAQLDLSPSRNPNRLWVEKDHLWYCVSWVAQTYESTLLEEVFAIAQKAYDRGDEVQGATKEVNAPAYKREKQSQFDRLGNRIVKSFLYGGQV